VSVRPHVCRPATRDSQMGDLGRQTGSPNGGKTIAQGQDVRSLPPVLDETSNFCILQSAFKGRPPPWVTRPIKIISLAPRERDQRVRGFPGVFLCPAHSPTLLGFLDETLPSHQNSRMKRLNVPSFRAPGRISGQTNCYAT
jgi:hypothetical protein